MIEYKRNLPHILPDDGVFFVTFRIYNSLPLNVLVGLKSEYEKEIKSTKSAILNSKLLKSRLNEIYDEYFYEFDSLLDQYVNDFDLSVNEKLSKIITDSIYYLDNKNYKLICYCIMPNHVHLIIYKLRKPLFEIMKVLKGYSAREINKELGRKGKFWHAESYDNVVRTKNELHNKIQYVLNNPVKAGLAKSRDEWKWSYCNPKFLES